MLKHFQLITNQRNAYVGLLAALTAWVTSFFVPDSVATALLLFAAPTGIFCFAYLIVVVLWPSARAGASRMASQLRKLPLLDSAKDHVQREAARLEPSESARLFAERFAEAFPGARSIQWYEGSEAVKRLEALLRKPLVFKRGDDGYTTPIWWWRDGNLQISGFRKLSRTTILLNSKELEVRRVAAIPSSDYKRCFVYLEAAPMKQCGAYTWDDAKIKEWVAEYGYAREEHGLYKSTHVLTRAEYDDNAAMIKGRLVRLGKDAELRERYITPYNLVIASHLSPINNPDFDGTLCSILDRMLQGEAALDELAATVRGLPKAQVGV